MYTLLREVKQQTGAFVGPLGRGIRSATTDEYSDNFMMMIMMIRTLMYDGDYDDHLFERLSPRSKNLFSWRPPTRISSHACWPSRSFSINIIIMIMILMTMMVIIIMIVIMKIMMRQIAIVWCPRSTHNFPSDQICHLLIFPFLVNVHFRSREGGGRGK